MMNSQYRNPVFNEDTYRGPGAVPATYETPMTAEGAIQKTLLLVGIVVALGAAVYAMGSTMVMPALIVGVLGGLITAIATIIKPRRAPISAPMYAAFEGLALGGISWLYQSTVTTGKYVGIVPMAILLTVGTTIGMLVLYRTPIIKVTQTYRMVIFGATLGLALTYGLTLLAGIFWPGAFQLPIYQPTGIGIAFSLFAVGLAALNLPVDFANIEEGAQRGAPKFFEWYGAFGVLVTLVWLYLEILRLLSKLNRR